MNPEKPPMSKPEQSSEEKEKKGYDFETASVNEKIYNVEMLESVAEHMKTEEMPLEDLRHAVGEGHYYWEDKKGEKLGPHQILKDWESAQENEDWADHVATIKRANLENRIWISSDGLVFNGMHRLTRAFVDGAKSIKVKKFSELPEDAEVND